MTPAHGEMHVRIAVLRAMYQRVPAMFEAGGYFFDAETEPPAAMLPDAPTDFGGPYSAIPTNGGYLFAMPAAETPSREVPFLGIGQTTQSDAGRSTTDNLYRLVRVEIPIVARVGVSEVEAGNRAALGVMQAYASTLCLAAMTAAMEGTPPVARALDATNALNIFTCGEVVRPPAIDLAAAQAIPSHGHGATTVDAVCVIAVEQWQYRAIGTPGVGPIP